MWYWTRIIDVICHFLFSFFVLRLLKLKLPNLGCGLSLIRVSYTPGSRRNSLRVIFLLTNLFVFRLLNCKLPWLTILLAFFGSGYALLSLEGLVFLTDLEGLFFRAPRVLLTEVPVTGIYIIRAEIYHHHPAAASLGPLQSSTYPA